MNADGALDHVFFPDSGVVSVILGACGRQHHRNGNDPEGRSSAVFKPSSVPSGLHSSFSCKSLEAHEDVARSVQDGHAVNAVLGNLHGRLRASLSQTGRGTVACNGAHSLKQRLARWLLMMRDRSDGDTLPITQELLAEMLGVQRPTISNAAPEIERAGLIERGRRQVTILDQPGLIEAYCGCLSVGPDASGFSPFQNIQ